MHALLITDAQFYRRERALIRRLEVGLMDEGVRLSLASPGEELDDAEGSGLIDLYPYRPSSISLTRRVRAQQLAESIAGKDGKRTPDVIHAFGGKAWGVASELSQIWGRPLVLEIWRSSLADRSKALAGTVRAPLALLTPDASIERELLRESINATVRLVRWGASRETPERTILREDLAWSIVIIGGGRDAGEYRVVLEGLAGLMEQDERIMLFVDSEASARSSLWKTAVQLGISTRVSLIDALEERRDLALRCDLMLCPEARGEQRTLLLDAMSSGMAIVAASDPAVASLVDGKTASLIPPGSAAGVWKSAIGALLDDPDRARELGRSAREFARETHRISAHVAGVLDVYEWCAGQRAASEKASGSGGTSGKTAG